MNAIYKVIFNAATNSWVAAPEFAKSRCKLRKSAIAVALILAIGAPFGVAMANERCELTNGQLGVQSDAGICDVDGRVEGFAIQPRTAQFPTAVGIAIDTGAVSRATAVGNGDIAIGGLSKAEGAGINGSWGTAVGDVAQATAAGATAIGSNASATVTGATALGSNTTVTATNAVAIGYGAEGNRSNAVSVGSATLQRQIVNVAAGTQSTDAVNVGQLQNTVNSIAGAIGGGAEVNADGTLSAPSYAVGGTHVNSIGAAITSIDETTSANAASIESLNDALGSGSVGLVKQDAATDDITVAADKAGTQVNFAGTDGARTLSGVAAGTLSANSNEAVNGAQLFDTNERVSAVEGGVITLTSDVTQLGTQVTSLDGRMTVAEGDISSIRTDLSSGMVGLVKQDAATDDITVAADKAGTQVNFAGTDGSRTLSGVAAGTLSANSNEAVNGAQLFDTNERVSAVEGGVITLTSDVTQLGTQVTSLDGRMTVAEGDINSIRTDLSSGMVGLVKQDAATDDITVAADKAGTQVNFAGTDGARTLSGVAAGTLSANSNEAVNGAQLFDTNERVGAVEGGVTTLNSNVTQLGTQVTSLDGRVDSIEGDLSSGVIGMVRHDPVTGNVTVATAYSGKSVDFTGSEGERVLSGVANGVDDSDAATVAQLKAFGLVDPNDGRALGALVYDDISLERATLGGSNGTVLNNVGNGLVAIGSREAVNGGQLASIRDDLQKQIGVVGDRVSAVEDVIADGSIGGNGTGNGNGNDGTVSDNGGSAIHNVGDGVANSDAANVGQVNQKFEQSVSTANAYTDTKFNQLQDDFNAFQRNADRRFDDLDRRIDRMAALSGAYAGMAMNTAGLTGKNRVGVGVGAQGGKSALAVGYQRIVGKNNNASLSIGGASSGSEKSVSAGAGFSW